VRGSRAGSVALLLVATVWAALFLAPELFGGRIASTARLDSWQPWAAQAPPVASGAVPSFNPDCLTSYYPRRAFLHDAWRDGELPFWNPYSFCGTPFLADPQAEALYPPSWLVLPLDPAFALGAFLFLHLAGAGFGMALLLRRCDAGFRIAVLGGCAYALSGFFAKHLGSPSFLATAAWLPWVFLAVEDTVRAPGVRSAARLALAGALAFLAGQPQIAMMIAYSAAVYGVVRWALSGTGVRHGGAVALAAATAGVVAVCLVSAQLLPTMELASRSARARLPWETVVSGALHPVETLRFLVPEFFGTPITGDEWSFLFPRGDSFYGRHQLNSVFAGTPVFLLALVGMVHPRTWRRALPFTVVFVVASLVTFGAPVLKPFAALPGMSVGRLDRAGCLVVFAQFVPAVLAALALAGGGARSRRAVGGAMIVAAVAGAWLVSAAGSGLPEALGATGPGSGAGLAAVVAPAAHRTLVAALFAAGAGAALLLPASRLVTSIPFALAALQLFLFAAPYRGDRDPGQVFAATPEIESLRASLGGTGGGYRFARVGRTSGRADPVSAILPPSTNVPHRLRDVQGYNALVDRRLGETLEAATGEPLFSSGIWSGRRIVAPQDGSALTHPLFAALSVREVVEPGRPAGGPSSRAFARSTIRTALPRVRLTATGRGVTESGLRDLLAARDLDPAREVVWVGDGRAGTPGDDLRPPEVLVDGRNHVRVRTNADREAVLVVADSWDTGWRATLDGAPVPILRAWGVVRAVVVPPGVHRVDMEYRPARFLPGAALSLLGLLLALGALATARSRPDATGT
jgi:Bacterial membrane protein YfhO